MASSSFVQKRCEHTDRGERWEDHAAHSDCLHESGNPQAARGQLAFILKQFLLSALASSVSSPSRWTLGTPRRFALCFQEVDYGNANVWSFGRISDIGCSTVSAPFQASTPNQSADEQSPALQQKLTFSFFLRHLQCLGTRCIRPLSKRETMNRVLRCCGFATRRPQSYC